MTRQRRSSDYELLRASILVLTVWASIATTVILILAFRYGL